MSTPGKLKKLNWSERNYAVLNRLITDYGKDGVYYDSNKPPYVVLDWDQTCAHLDVQEAVMHYQLFNLRLKLTKEQFKDLLKDEINGVTNLSVDFQKVKLADVNHDLLTAYSFLYDNFIALGGTMSLDEIKLTPAYYEFIAKIPFLYAGYCSTPGITDYYAYPWIIGLLSGQTTDEVRLLARDAINFELQNKLAKKILSCADNPSSKVGSVRIGISTGLRVIPEMQNLINCLNESGIDVYIVSASFKPVVEVFSGLGSFGYNVFAENVIGMQLETTDENIILPHYKSGWPVTYREGKVTAINRIIKSGLCKTWDPVFSAIDSDGDYEMATSFQDMKLTLIWNRLKGGDIGKLCKRAVEEVTLATPRYILQGRDENTGKVIPFSESVLLGEDEPRLLYGN